MSSEPMQPDKLDDLVLRQLQGMRRDLAALRANQRQNRELILKLTMTLQERFADRPGTEAADKPGPRVR